MMIGGYLSFSGFQARAAFRQTAIAEVLPVTMLAEDDRVETPAGIVPTVVDAAHPALGVPAIPGRRSWDTTASSRRTVPWFPPPSTAIRLSLPVNTAPGRSIVFTSDCSPHWAPPEFCEQWPGYTDLFDGLISWVAGE